MPEVIFFAPHNRNLRIGADEIQEEVRLGNGVITKPSYDILFQEHFKVTDDLKVQKAIRRSDSFKKGRVLELTEAQMHVELAKIAKKRLEGGGPAEIILPTQKSDGYVPTENVAEVIPT